MKRLKIKRFHTIMVMIFLALALPLKKVNGQEDSIRRQSYPFFRAEIDRIANARYRLGPFSIFPSITLHMGYDNNVFRSDSPQFTIADYTARVGFPISVFLRYRNWLILSLVERPEYVFYFKTKGLRSWNNTLSSQLRILVLNRFVVSGNFVKSRIRHRVTVEIDTPIYEDREEFIGSIFYEPRGKISIGFSAAIREMRYDDISLSQRLDRNVKSTMLTLFYNISTGSQVFLRGGYSQFSFQNVTVLSRETDSFWINSGIAFPLLGRLRGILSLGYSKFSPRDEIWPDFSGFVGNTALTWSISRFRFRLSYFRNTSFSAGTSLYFVNDGAGLGVSFFLTPSIRLGYDFNYGTADYPLPGLGDLLSRRDIYRNHTARVILRIIGNTGIGIDVSYWERDSNFIGVSRENTFVLLYLTTSFNL